MKVVALVLLSLFAGFIGLAGGMAVGGLGICATSVSNGTIIGIAGVGIIVVLIGAWFGPKLAWIVPTAYCLPVALIGGVVPISFPEWNRVRVAWVSVGCVVIAYGLCYGWLSAATKQPSKSP